MVSALPIAEEAACFEAAIDEALARAVLYHALALGLRPPTGDEARSDDPIGRAASRDAAALLDARAPSEAVLAAVERLDGRAASPKDRLGAHARLFGHSRGLVCPFETEYGKGNAFRQPQELADIAGTYLAFGLKPQEGGDERVDHAACECEFMGFLARMEAFALGSLQTNGDQEEMKERIATTRGAARGFLREHLGRFGRAFASLLMKEDADGFHGALGAVLFRFLAQECQRFGLPPGPPSLELRPPMTDDTPMACGRADPLSRSDGEQGGTTGFTPCGPDDELIQIQRRPRP
jgi:TorA maturation chaperone TorD